MKNHAEAESSSMADAADAVAHIRSEEPPGPSNRSIAGRKYDALALVQYHGLAPGLYPRPLLGQEELTADEVDAGTIENDG